MVMVVVLCLSVCVSVTTKSATYLVNMLKTRHHRVLYGIIWQSPLLSLLPDELPMKRRDSDGLFSTKLVSRPSVSSYNTTDLSLIMLK